MEILEKIQYMLDDPTVDFNQLHNSTKIAIKDLNNIKKHNNKLRYLSYLDIKQLFEYFEGFYTNQKIENLNFNDLYAFNQAISDSEELAIANTINDLHNYVTKNYYDDLSTRSAWSELEQNWDLGETILDMVTDSLTNGLANDFNEIDLIDLQMLNAVNDHGLNIYYSVNNDYEPLDSQEFKSIVNNQPELLKRIQKD